MSQPELQRFYTRSDPRGLFPYLSGSPNLEHNRLAVFWRPLIDMTDSEASPTRLRMIAPVSSWLADPAQERWPWFSMIGIPGLRHQVLRHAGLRHYDCADPTALPEALRTPAWSTLIQEVNRFDMLGPARRALVLFALAQLSYCIYALKLAGEVEPDGRSDHDHYVYHVARLHARTPGQVARALDLFGALSITSRDPMLVAAACFQGIGHSLRDAKNLTLARNFAQRGAAQRLPDTWHGWLVGSRFRRATALLRLAEGRLDWMRHDMETALAFNERLLAAATEPSDRMVAVENTRYLLELRIQARDGVLARCGELIQLDPYCVEARLIAGDGHLAAQDYASAARWYSHAGELGTGSGAVGWFRAAQCHDFLGERGEALNAMGRCLELDSTAVEARNYLAAHH
ncbi:hypothetical protein Rhe02_62810 [Rhizocola hellebori]|uniref:Tetratricopeptide repeat protein n=1 Tax=Rhizocola hellebori TaxID=1392758 RepID=A0A8J3VIA7_9ACTN|nr:hypothetical protein [Rhizocola hellebori]GIH08214.1 hypothetical protein Rhe02_62810 [Rhizocola hellebori]